MGLCLASCSVDPEVEGNENLLPQGTMTQPTSADGLVTAAYSYLGNDWYGRPFNLWPYGDLASDDALKGGGAVGDTDYNQIETFTITPSSTGHHDELWYHLYCAISRCNQAIEAVEKNSGKEYDDATKTQRLAEVRFLRAHFYYKLQQVFYCVPLIKEGMSNSDIDGVKRWTEGTDEAGQKASHDAVMQFIVDEFKFAYENLAHAAPGSTGRAHKIAAAAYLEKCYLNWAYGDGYENTTNKSIDTEKLHLAIKYGEEVKASAYTLLPDFGDVFLQDYANSSESIFAVQHSAKASDGTKFGRGNWSNVLNGVYGIWSMGHDFHKPSQNLVDAFKTQNGLPMDLAFGASKSFDEDYNVYPFKDENDNLSAKSVDADGNVNTVTQTFDPRLFHTVGMPTFPYKYEAGMGKKADGSMVSLTLSTSNTRDPNDYGYYCSMKEVPPFSTGDNFDDPWQEFAMNDYVLRTGDCLLMLAEAYVEDNKLDKALDIVNQIRLRAQNSVAKHISYAAGLCDIKPYTSFPSQDYARKAVRWERRLELAMEHERFFDLRRWALLSTTIAAYEQKEANVAYDGKKYRAYYKGTHFTPQKNEYWPVHNNQMNYVSGLYSPQNKNY